MTVGTRWRLADGTVYAGLSETRAEVEARFGQAAGLSLDFLASKMDAPVCCITSTTPAVVSKVYRLTESGELQKRTSGNLSAGRIEVVEVESLEVFATLLASRPRQRVYSVGYQSRTIAYDDASKQDAHDVAPMRPRFFTRN